MECVCNEHSQTQTKVVHPAHQLYLCAKKSPLRDVDIPPRKLLSRRLAALQSSESAMEFYQQLQLQQQDSPRVLPEESLFQKFLPYNNSSAVDADDSDDPYSSDHFRMFEFKVRKCTRSRSHDWTDCPFAHPGEKARRRCPRRYGYSGEVCPDYRRGSCARGDLCEFAHGVFECWLHPSRYRTEACKDGRTCQRKICFFAHTPSQLRVLPVDAGISPAKVAAGAASGNSSGHGCVYCRCHSGNRHNSASPTSTLNLDIENLSPPSSPPFSPAQPGAGFSPVSRFADRFMTASSGSISELISSVEALSVADVNANHKPLWVDSGFNGDPTGNDQFVRSPATAYLNQENNKVVGEGGSADVDFGWVNDLLT